MNETKRKRLTHLRGGKATMVDVLAKAPTLRVAVAGCEVTMRAATFATITRGTVAKGNVLETARLAGIQAAKRTPELIPLCHPLALGSVRIEFAPDRQRRRIGVTATVRAFDRTGVEMEALTAAAVAGLTIYDMAKAIDRGMTIGKLQLLEKSGGRSGRYRRPGTGQCRDGDRTSRGRDRRPGTGQCRDGDRTSRGRDRRPGTGR